jgi:hypothetical protein
MASCSGVYDADDNNVGYKLTGVGVLWVRLEWVYGSRRLIVQEPRA